MLKIALSGDVMRIGKMVETTILLIVAVATIGVLVEIGIRAVERAGKAVPHRTALLLTLPFHVV